MRNLRWVLVAAMVVSVPLVLWQQGTAIAGSFRDLGLLDVQIYRMGGAAVLDGDALY